MCVVCVGRFPVCKALLLNFTVPPLRSQGRFYRFLDEETKQYTRDYVAGKQEARERTLDLLVQKEG